MVFNTTFNNISIMKKLQHYLNRYIYNAYMEETIRFFLVFFYQFSCISRIVLNHEIKNSTKIYTCMMIHFR
jgi:hypothetical protein